MGRSDLGIPENWYIVEDWLDTSVIPEHPGKEKAQEYTIKNKEIPLLQNYSTTPEETFWEKFPVRKLPDSPSTRVNVRNFAKLLKEHEHKFTESEWKRAQRTIMDLRTGADSYQLSSLPALATKNSTSTYTHGAFLTDKIATWIVEKVVCGPFDNPPMPGFRANPLVAIARNGKIRPVINMSGPKGKSFNDNLDKYKIEKVRMCTAKKFSYSIKEAGKGALFSKFDLKDAYKLVPARPEDFRLQGFTWLEKSFIETQQTFGAIPSVSNFDRLGKTVETLVSVISGVPRQNISRTLDDFQVVGKKDSDMTKRFGNTMRKVCGFLNIPLAELCPNREKAFEMETRGFILGTGFDSDSGTWFISEEKADKIKRRCLEVYNTGHIDLLQTQKVMGSANDLAQMNTFLKFFKHSGNSMIARFKNNENILLPVTEKMKSDLLVICKAAESAKNGLPIASRKVLPPLSSLVFYTDAAGAKYCWQDKKFHLIEEKDRGVACVGGREIEDIWIWSRFSWSSEFMNKKDDKGVEFGRKSTTLESIALLIPFIFFPEKIAGKFLEFQVDNIAVHYGWGNGGIKNDNAATEVLKTVHILASYLGCRVYVNHVHRVSNPMADLADELTRKTSSSNPHYEQSLSRSMNVPANNNFIENWLKDSTVPLYKYLLPEIKKRVP